MKCENLLLLIFFFEWTFLCYGGIAPPHWVDLNRNPCAAQPNGWQLLYWHGDQKCYKIFQVGFPCPDTMELTPSLSPEFVAECTCPPGTAHLQNDTKCHLLFERGPCKYGEYFAPETHPSKLDHSQRLGVCVPLKTCEYPFEIWWPKEDQCYLRLTRGPCPEGLLLTNNTTDGMPKCHCDPNSEELKPFYWKQGNSCHELYTRGPCQQFSGDLFLPSGKCGCNRFLPHYHLETHKCYKLGDIGPCAPGNQFKLVQHPTNSEKMTGKCMCKDGYIYWETDGSCYRPFSQGPCKPGQFLSTSATCLEVPCSKGQLYFPGEDRCYRLGSQGPCDENHVVTFDYSVRPSVDGISYLGTCDCSMNLGGKRCPKNHQRKSSCDYGKVLLNGVCHMLYTQGPCELGKWVVSKRKAKWQLWDDDNNSKNVHDTGICECRPGYSEVRKMVNTTLISVTCHAPIFRVAKYLTADALFKSVNKVILE